jgi:hypothetical protein
MKNQLARVPSGIVICLIDRLISSNDFKEEFEIKYVKNLSIPPYSLSINEYKELNNQWPLPLIQPSNNQLVCQYRLKMSTPFPFSL